MHFTFFSVPPPCPKLCSSDLFIAPDRTTFTLFAFRRRVKGIKGELDPPGRAAEKTERGSRELRIYKQVTPTELARSARPKKVKCAPHNPCEKFTCQPLIKVAEPQLEAFAGQPLDFRRQAPESVTKASGRRGNHRAGRWLAPGFPISADGKLRATCRSARLPRFGGPTGDFARRRTNGRVGRSPCAKGGRWPARCPQRNSCITISPDSAIISSFKRGGALGRARSVFSSFAINKLRNRSDHPHGTRFSAYRRPPKRYRLCRSPAFRLFRVDAQRRRAGRGESSFRS